jgi:hypothetical protein
VTALDAGAFYNCQSLASIAFAAKSSLTAIGDSCFMYAGLTSFTLPSMVTNLGNSVFQSCKKLVKADFSANTTLTYIPNGTFRGDFSLTEVKIGASITSLGSYCFADTALTAFTIPGTVTVIGNGAFSGLDDVVITDSSTADYLDGNLLYQDSTKSNLLMALGKVTSYQAPASLKTFSESAFAGHTSLTSLDLSQIPATTASVTIGYNSFYGSGISSLTFPSQTTTQFTLENDAFYGTSFTSLTLPKSVTSIGNVGFAECHSLAHVDLSQSGITSLSASLFAGDNALEDVILPAGLTSIGSYVFSDCSQLQAIYLRETSEPDTSIYTPVTTTGTGWNCISSASYFNTYSVIAPYYLYSETKPTSNVSHYWHYVDSKPVVWQNEE